MNQKNTSGKLILFSDFDGTISTRDVGNRLFYHFSGGKSEEVVARWKRNEIDSRQCLLGEAASMRSFSEQELHDFIDSFEIDETFLAFKDFAAKNNFPLYLLSDGLDLYITRLLAKYRISGIPVLANTARYADGGLTFEFPYFEQSCGNCANCKGYHLRRLRIEGATVVYIGDGKSDLCALPEADMIFAKDYLAEYCLQERIEFLPFDTFSAITQVLTEHILKFQD
ncbi:MAG: MtnX-like HAD-IB family phosphatase [Candidatus Zixiibacteriota bacterium]